MADQKITDLTATTTVDSTGLIPVVNDVATTPVNEKITYANLSTQIRGDLSSSNVLTALGSQSANRVLAAPNGSSGAMTVRALVAADIPSLTISKISDFPSQTSNSGKYLTTDGSTLSWATVAGGGGGTWGSITGTLSSQTDLQSALDAKISSGAAAIVNADVNASAAIALSKLAAVTASRALVSSASGFVSASSVTSTALGYVANLTSDAQTQLDAKEPTISAGTTGQYWRGDKSWQALNKSAVGLSNVENTALSTWAGTTNLTTIGAATATSLTLSGTAGAGYLELANQSSAPGTPTSASRIFIDSSNRLSWKGTNGFIRTFDGTGNTADRVYTLPNVSGTVVTTGDTGSVTNAMLAGSIAISKLSVTGTPDGTKFLRDDGSWAAAGGGGSPGGSGSELQFRGGASTFSAVTGSSVSGANVTLGGTLTATSLKFTSSGSGVLLNSDSGFTASDSLGGSITFWTYYGGGQSILTMSKSTFTGQTYDSIKPTNAATLQWNDDVGINRHAAGVLRINSFGTGSGQLLIASSSATASAQLHAVSGSASRVGLRVDSAASPTADIAQFTVNSTVNAAFNKDGRLVMTELSSNPAAADVTSGSNAKDKVAMYMKADKLVFAYNDGAGTVNYLSIALDGSTTTWTNSSSAP
jgi:hypothetical protein